MTDTLSLPGPQDRTISVDIIAAPGVPELPGEATKAADETDLQAAVRTIEAVSGLIMWPIRYEGCDLEGGLMVADVYRATLGQPADGGLSPQGEIVFRLPRPDPSPPWRGSLSQAREETQAVNQHQREKWSGRSA